MQHRAGSERVLTVTEQENKAQTSTHVTTACFIALKCAVLDNQSAAPDINCSSLKQFKSAPPDVEQRAGSERVLRVFSTTEIDTHILCAVACKRAGMNLNFGA